MKSTSFGGARYFITFTDDKSRQPTVYFMKSKSEVLGKFKQNKGMVEKITRRPTVSMHYDAKTAANTYCI